MERNTKIFIGVGAAALIAFLLLRKKAAATTTGTASGGTALGGGTASGGGSATPDTCPDGQVRVQLQCIKAPCGSMCMPVGGSNGTGVDLPPQDVVTNPCMTARLSCSQGFIPQNVDGVCRCVVDDTILILDPPALGDYSGRMKEMPATPVDYIMTGKSDLVNLYL